LKSPLKSPLRTLGLRHAAPSTASNPARRRADLGPDAGAPPERGGSPAARLGLTQDILQGLERLSIPSRRSVLGGVAGRRRSRRYGSSLDLADYRAYTAGDDIRRLDWSAYARLGRLYMRLYAGEEDACVGIWVDTSASMAWDEATKERPARAVSGALAFMALAAEDRAAIVGFSGTIVARAGPVRGKLSAPRIWAALADLPRGGATEWRAVAAAASSVPRGVSVIVSDFLAEPDELRPALSALRRAGNELFLVQLLSPEELRPTLMGELRLVDCETGASVDVTLGHTALEAYQKARSEHALALSSLAKSYQATLVSLDGGLPLRQLVLGELVRARVASI
jgi:uncharacterized protein (DUF58 family)